MKRAHFLSELYEKPENYLHLISIFLKTSYNIDVFKE